MSKPDKVKRYGIKAIRNNAGDGGPEWVAVTEPQPFGQYVTWNDHTTSLEAECARLEKQGLHDRLWLGYAIAGKQEQIRKQFGGNAPERIQGELDAAHQLHARLAEVEHELAAPAYVCLDCGHSGKDFGLVTHSTPGEPDDYECQCSVCDGTNVNDLGSGVDDLVEDLNTARAERVVLQAKVDDLRGTVERIAADLKGTADKTRALALRGALSELDVVLRNAASALHAAMERTK